MRNWYGFTVLAATGIVVLAGPARLADAQSATAHRVEAAVQKAEAAANKAEAAANQAETLAKAASDAAQKAEELSQKAEELSHKHGRRAARVAKKLPAGQAAAAPALAAARPAVSPDAISKRVIEYYRRKANVPPSAQVEVKDLADSKIRGAKTGVIQAGAQKAPFTVSEDGRYVVFGELEDVTVDPFAGVMKKISLKGKPFKGPADAKVTIVEYSDFQCPFCSRGYQTIENQVLKEYGDKVKFFYKNFPLGMHPWAEAAAVASECALQQKPEAFWKLYNFYFSNQRDITAQNLKDKSLEALKDDGIDAAKFSDCLDNKKTLDLVKADQNEGASVGVNGTPAFLINGRLISGALPFENFKTLIESELARADKK